MQEEVNVVKVEEQNKEEIVETKEEKRKKVKEKKPKKKMGKLELTFNILSLCFLVGFSIFYGYRLLHYKKVFTPKSSSGEVITLLGNTLKSKVVTSGEGLYHEGRYYIYKGEKVNNYVQYSNMLWRVTKINADGTIEMVLDDTLNYLAFDKEKTDFENSNLNEYLNTKFYNNLNTSVLTKGTYCKDSVSDLNSVTCNKKSTTHVKLLSVTDYLSSKMKVEVTNEETNEKEVVEKSYLDGEDVVWLYNNNGEQVWLMNNSSLSLSSPNELYQVKPVVILNNVVGVYSGEGTLEKPYVIEEKTTYFASYVKLGDDLYRVYDELENSLKLSMDNIYRNGDTKYQFSNKSNVFNLEDGVGRYLNTTFLEEIPYSDLLVECEYDIGVYNRYYSNVSNQTIKAKVGLNSIIDPIFNKEALNYYLTTPFEEEYTYIYNDDVYAVKPNLVRNVKPTICINKNVITSGNGTKDDPYMVDVKENVKEESSGVEE